MARRRITHRPTTDDHLVTAPTAEEMARPAGRLIGLVSADPLAGDLDAMTTYEFLMEVKAAINAMGWQLQGDRRHPYLRAMVISDDDAYGDHFLRVEAIRGDNRSLDRIFRVDGHAQKRSEQLMIRNPPGFGGLRSRAEVLEILAVRVRGIVHEHGDIGQFRDPAHRDRMREAVAAQISGTGAPGPAPK